MPVTSIYNKKDWWYMLHLVVLDPNAIDQPITVTTAQVQSALLIHLHCNKYRKKTSYAVKQLFPDECSLFNLSGAETVYMTTST